MDRNEGKAGDNDPNIPLNSDTKGGGITAKGINNVLTIFIWNVDRSFEENRATTARGQLDATSSVQRFERSNVLNAWQLVETTQEIGAVLKTRGPVLEASDSTSDIELYRFSFACYTFVSRCPFIGNNFTSAAS